MCRCPVFKMEFSSEDNALTVDSSLIMPLDSSEHARSPQDLMTRRLKNRERQRRYRLRKRIEAERKASIMCQSAPPEIQLQLPELSSTCATRVHCQRNWKKDARRAHFIKEEVNKTGERLMSCTTPIIGGQVPCLPSGVDQQLPLESEIQFRSSSVIENSETPRSTLSRRHWKAEARNKKY